MWLEGAEKGKNINMVILKTVIVAAVMVAAVMMLFN